MTSAVRAAAAAAVPALPKRGRQALPGGQEARPGACGEEPERPPAPGARNTLLLTCTRSRARTRYLFPKGTLTLKCIRLGPTRLEKGRSQGARPPTHKGAQERWGGPQDRPVSAPPPQTPCWFSAHRGQGQVTLPGSATVQGGLWVPRAPGSDPRPPAAVRCHRAPRGTRRIWEVRAAVCRPYNMQREVEYLTMTSPSPPLVIFLEV